MTPNLQDLPDELIELCSSFSDMWAAKAFRLTCRRMAPLARRRLFSRVILEPTEWSADNVRCILDDKRLSSLVNTISVRASVSNLEHVTWELDDDKTPSSDDEEDWYEGDTDEVPVGFKNILADIGGFKNLRRVEVKHDQEVAEPSQDRYASGNHREWIEYRQVFFCKLFAGLKQCKGLRSLSIENYQDVVDVEATTSEEFRAVLARLDSLELGIAVEYVDASPESGIEIPERHRFFSHDLLKYWLEPVQGQLVHLKLYCTDYWGYIPRCDLRRLHFPKLQSLSLGNMTFTHNWQMDWILSHSETLRVLTLDDCPIVHAAEVSGPLDREHYPVVDADNYELSFDGPDHRWTFESRWHDYFRQIMTRLPKLSYFGMGHGPWNAYSGEPTAFEIAHRLPAELDPGRYVIFQWGTGPSQWIEPRASREYRRQGEIDSPIDLGEQYDCCWDDDHPTPAYPACTEEDRQALKELMEMVRARQG